MRRALACCAIASGLLSTPALGEEEYEWEAARVHSDLPLYTFDWEETWPRSFAQGEGDDFEFGCINRVSFGDWKFTPNPDDEYADSSWFRFSNYGVFHCAANIRKADGSDGLEEGDFSYGLFVKMGEADKQGEQYELWALQEGFVPGSDYILLSRKASDKGIVARFNVLQRRCPQSRMREVEGMDIFITRYCAINTRAEMLEFAKQMLREPPLGTIELTNEKGSDQSPDPSESDNAN